MNAGFWINLVISLFFVIFFGWKTIPTSVLLFYPDRIRRWYTSSADDVELIARQDKVSDLLEKVESLGFSPLGVKSEQLPLWAKSLREITLASQKENAFASVTKIGRTRLYYFYTPFVDGSMVLTANAAFPTCKTHDFVQTIVPSSEPEKVLQAHRQHVQEFRNRGAIPFDTYTQGTRIKATDQYYAARAIRQLMQRVGLVNLLIFLGVLFLASTSIWASIQK